MKQFFSCLLLLAALCPAALAQIDWQSTNGPEGGGQYGIFGNSQYAFYTDAYKFFRTADGLTWEQFPYANFFPIAINEEKVVAVKYDNGINTLVVSYDNGATWINGTMPPLTRLGISAAVCSQGIYYPDIIDYPNGLNNRLFRSQDDGLTWDTIVTPGPYCENVYSFDDRLYVQQENKYWRLAMNGIDWELISPLLNESPQCLFVSGATRIIATTNNLWSSSNNGVSWKKRYVPYNNRANDNFAAVGSRIYWIAGSTGLMYTDDQGDTWQEIPDPRLYGLAVCDVIALGDKLLCAINGKGVAYLNETTNTFIPVNEGLTSASIYNLQAGSTDLWAACGNGVFAYDLATQQWVDKAPLPMPRSHYEQVAVSPSGKIAAFAS